MKTYRQVIFAQRRFYVQRLRQLSRSQKGQGLTEYIFLVVLVALVCIPMVRILPDAIRGYVRPFYYCLSRPLP